MPTKPFSGFGWIETNYLVNYLVNLVTTKPFSGFGWIETRNSLDIHNKLI